MNKTKLNHKLHEKLKLSHHRHTRRRLPRGHTSYGLLIFLLLMTGVIVFQSTRITQSTNAVLGDQVTLTGVMPNAPPQEQTVITEPQNNFGTSSETLTVKGTCGNYIVVVQIFRNDIFAGSTLCESGLFEVIIHLEVGSNILVAKAADSFAQYAPDSDPVTVVYTVPVVTPGTTNPGTRTTPKAPGIRPLLLTTDKPYLGANYGKPLDLRLIVQGGQGPYALEVLWGDGEQELLTQSSAGSLSANHKYTSGGLYTIRVKAVDSLKNATSLQLAAIVQGPAVAPAGNGAKDTEPDATPYVKPSLAIIWPIYLFLLALLVAFWLGERYELHKLRASHRVIR